MNRHLLFGVFLVMSLVACVGQAEKSFKSTLPGRWYPTDKAELVRLLDELYGKAEAKPLKDVIALIQPHAGYTYSGKTAFCGLKSLPRLDYKRIVILGPTHGVSLQDMYSVPRYDSFETPLGKVKLDTEFIDRLLWKSSIFRDIPAALTQEHSVQIQLPLIQYACSIRGNAVPPAIVFIIAGQCSPETVRQAGRILAGMMDDDTLLIVSSDFTHYGPNFDYVPFDENIPQKLNELDMDAYKMIAKKDSDGFQKFIKTTGDTVCGHVAIATSLCMMPADASCVKINYTTSGEISGDYRNSVSYFSIAFTGKWQAGKDSMLDVKQDGGLSTAEKSTLLSTARKTIQWYLDKGRVPTPADLGLAPTAQMKEERACFVTLKKNGELRGCIGEIFPSQPLHISVIQNAVASAVRDPRFNPVGRGELESLVIEISALTPPKKVSSYKDIRIGTDGMVLRKGGRSAVFLPQVAPEQGWDIETTLTHLSMKAGLPADAWKEGASYLTFQADVFTEKE